MILYHGSNVDIESIDLGRSSVGKDFGCGFYLTASREQAERMGRRRAGCMGERWWSLHSSLMRMQPVRRA